ncbi:sensor domain-containing diguanylate cyclase [Vibrio brasiliensis]|uniref:sensor domain-containing diguanylate cyclase n=1 Tax=Vibrio brasiliensis TaxID=170652 RepID=UPI001EFD178F|nr:diguanylate cyclase [Vibrio brasiliensis]MCG9726973.1 diguanylate cyclase [Vibrio brasiliensis]
MKSLNDLSLKSKLIIPIIVFTGLIFVLSQGFAFFHAFDTQKDNLIDRVGVLAKGVAFNLQAAILFDDSLAATEVLDAFSADDEVSRVKLYTSDGQLFAMYEGDGPVAPVPTERQRMEISHQGYSIGSEHIFLLVPVELENEIIAYLRVIISKSSFKELYDSALLNSLMFLVLLTLAGIVLYMTVQKYIVNPVYRLNLGMRSFIDRKQTDLNITPAANDEIGALVSAFNTMLDRLKQRDLQVEHTLDKLEEEKSFANQVVEAVKHALVVVNSKGQIIHFNESACQVFRCTSAYLKGASILDFIDGGKSTLIEQAIKQQQEFVDQQFWVTDVFEQRQLLQVSCAKLSKLGQMLFAIQDVTEVEMALQRQRLAAGVFEHSQDALIVTDENDVITMVNPALTLLLGYSQDSLLGKKTEQIFEWQQFRSLMPTIKESVINYGQWQGEVWEKHFFGHKVPMFAKVSRIVNNDDENAFDFVYILTDLSNLKEMERLEHLAHHDSLTGLANRAKLYRVLSEVLSGERSGKDGLALLYLDLDGFKGVNDTYGHDAGDEVLKQVSDRLLSQVRSNDLVARLSGDEFVIMINSTTKQSVSILAERLVALIQKEIIYKGRQLKVGASIGVHFVEDYDKSMDELLKAADTAMYQAKASGKGRFVINHG